MSLQLARMDAESAQIRAQEAQAQLERDVAKANEDLQANIKKANEDLDKRRQQAEQELQVIREQDLATIKAKAEEAALSITQAQQRLEEARDALNKDVQALKAKSMSNKDALKAELLANANGIIDTVPWELQWVIPILTEGRDRMQQGLDAIMQENEGLISWVVPRPVDPEAIKKIIEQDLRTLQAEQAAKVKE